MSNGRCKMHGGKQPRGIDRGSFKHGRYSKSIPDRLVGRYEQALADEKRHDLRDEISLSEAKVDDLLSRMDSGESDGAWLHLRDLAQRLRRAGNEATRRSLLAELLSVITVGADEALAWSDVDRWTARKQRLVESDMRVAQVKQQMVSAEEVMTLVAAILDAIRTHVEDQDTRAALARELRSIGDRGGVVIPMRRADSA